MTVNAATQLWKYCLFFGKYDKQCNRLVSCPETCQGEIDGTVCAQFICYNETICKDHKKHRITFYDVVDWDLMGSINNNTPSQQKSMMQFKEV
jgi:hypothetical protein